MATTAIARNSKGLVDALFDTIDQLNAKKIDAEHARAISHSARTIVSIAALELDVRRFQMQQGAEHHALRSLAIEGIAEKVA